MSLSSSVGLALYGTTQPPVEMESVQVGSLSFQAEGAQLRHLVFHGQEVVRSAGLVIRDSHWGTHELCQLRCQTDTRDGAWSRRIEGVVGEGDSAPVLDWALEMEVSDDGLSISTELNAYRDFPTCRAGLMVLHPLNGVVGVPVSVLHSDGRVERGCFPELISPSQPFFDIKGLTYTPAPGLVLEWTFDGDVFEMEDQRNWSDASFKTYNRPLALPCPYVIGAGESIRQCVALNLSGDRRGIQ